MKLVKKNWQIFYNLPVCTSTRMGKKGKYVKFHFYDNKIPLWVVSYNYLKRSSTFYWLLKVDEMRPESELPFFPSSLHILVILFLVFSYNSCMIFCMMFSVCRARRAIVWAALWNFQEQARAGWELSILS